MTGPPASLVEGQVQIVQPPPLATGLMTRQVPLWLALALALACLFFGILVGVMIVKV